MMGEAVSLCRSRASGSGDSMYAVGDRALGRKSGDSALARPSAERQARLVGEGGPGNAWLCRGGASNWGGRGGGGEKNGEPIKQ